MEAEYFRTANPISLYFFLPFPPFLFLRTNQIDERNSAMKAHDQIHKTFDTMTTVTSMLNTTETSIPDVDTYFNLYIYAGIIVVMFVCSLTRAFLYFNLAVNAGENLHNMMFARSLRATMAFFDTNPVGQFSRLLQD